MLFRNLLFVVFFIGMVFSIPVDDEKESKDVSTTDTISASKSNDDVITFEIDATEKNEVVIEDSEGKKGVTDADDDVKEEKKEEVKEEKKDKDDAKEEKEVKEEKEEKVEKAEKEEKVEKEEEEVKEEKEEEKKVKSEDSQEKTKDVSSSGIPDKDDIPSELENTCTKDHLILGNQVNTDVCDEIYDACTTQELLSIIVYFYSKDSPISIEYSINEEKNKEMISEQCATALVNSKVFFQETVEVAPIDEIPEVEEVTQLTQDLPTETSKEHIIEPTLSPDPYAEFSEDDIKENEN